MTAVALNVGDVVTLKSGGKPMTVETMKNDDVSVVWADQQHRIRREKLKAICLRISSDEFDGVADLVIEGITHTRGEVDDYLEAAGRA